MLSLQLLVDMVTGQLGDQGEQSGAAAISRVLLAGNLLSQTTQDKEASTKVRRGPVRGDQGSTHMDFFRADTDFNFFISLRRWPIQIFLEPILLFDHKNDTMMITNVTSLNLVLHLLNCL